MLFPIPLSLLVSGSVNFITKGSSCGKGLYYGFTILHFRQSLLLSLLSKGGSL